MHIEKRGQDDPRNRNGLEWTLWMAGFGLFLSVLYVVLCIVFHHPVIFYGS